MSAAMTLVMAVMMLVMVGGMVWAAATGVRARRGRGGARGPSSAQAEPRDGAGWRCWLKRYASDRNAGLEGETQRILRLYEREAPKYDREMRLFELLLFAGGREWVCSQAEGEVLEIAVGTGRNLPHYRDGVVRLTGVELSPAMLAIASIAGLNSTP